MLYKLLSKHLCMYLFTCGARKLFADLRQEIGPQEDHGFQPLVLDSVKK